MSREQVNLLASSNNKINGCIRVPGDKSISHRAIIISSIAKGKTQINQYLDSEDINATIDVCRRIQADIVKHNESLIITGNNLERIQKEDIELNFGNSGTSMRLMMGVLSAQIFSSILSGDESLSQRPMDRVSKPLINMNANIKTSNGTPPIFISPDTETSPSNSALPVILDVPPIEVLPATPRPPATVNAPSVVLEFAVVAVIETTPPEEIPMAFVSEDEPIFPASAITMLPVVNKFEDGL